MVNISVQDNHSFSSPTSVFLNIEEYQRKKEGSETEQELIEAPGYREPFLFSPHDLPEFQRADLK